MENNDESIESKKHNNKNKLMMIIMCIVLVIVTIFLKNFFDNDSLYMYKNYENIMYVGDRYVPISKLQNLDQYIIVDTYAEYKELVNNQNIEDNYDSNFFEDKSVLLLKENEFYVLHDVSEENHIVNVSKWRVGSLGTAAIPSLFVIPISKNISEVNVSEYYNYVKPSIKTILNFMEVIAILIVVTLLIKDSKNKKIWIILGIIGLVLYLITIYINANTTIAYKPIIYLYPTKEQDVSVTFNKPDKITCSYPKYINGWNVLAKPNGDLTDLDTGKNLYSLYYESENSIKFEKTNEGFCIKGEDTATFLEDKLTILGLNERESEEFIIYWLPKLEANKYNYIRFATKNEINENMPLEISPKPDTMIRVLMTYKGLNRPVQVEEQELVTPERNGFVVVEWGGTETE